ncbi:helicase-related protein [Opitutales bacterium]|nr:helicase-related protein [Opitutales bacterium]
MDAFSELPVFQEFEKFKQKWETNSHVILKSPTGSGKSIALPYLLSKSGLATGKILVVQPRRIAARVLAGQVARMVGWSIGKEVGYQVRFDKKYCSTTQIVYVTDGIALAKLLDEEKLNEFEVLILDEFHERSAQIDLCLGLALQLWKSSKPDLRIIVTSATLNLSALNEFIPQSGCLELKDRSYPVEVEYQVVKKELPPWKSLVDLLPRLLSKMDGDILIFMDGAYEISKTVSAIITSSWSSGLEIRSLFGDLSSEKQDMALAPSKKRKIIVSTNIAETSLTIEGVRIVIDTGKAKKMRYDQNRGINALLSEPISKSSADQRAGRAGRLGPGYCLRLWSHTEHEKRVEFDLPEINRIDLSQIYLNLLRFDLDLEQLDLFDSIAQSALNDAKTKLKDLGALTDQNNLTEHGIRMSRLPVHPNWSHALLKAKEKNLAPVIALLLAMLEERPPVQSEVLSDFYPMPNPRSDAYCLLLAFEEASRRKFSAEDCRKLGIHAGRCKDSELLAHSLCNMLGLEYKLEIPSFDELSQILISCFPRAIARLVSAGRRIYEDAQGRRLHLSKRSVLGSEHFILPLRVVEKKIRGSLVLEMEWATGLNEDWIRKFIGPKKNVTTEVYLDLNTRKVVKKEVESWQNLILSIRESEDVSKEEKTKAYANALLLGDLKLKKWDVRVDKLLERKSFLARHFPELGIKEFDDGLKVLFFEQLCESGSTWREIRNLDVYDPLRNCFSKEENELLDEAVPEKINLGTKNRTYPIDYSDQGEVVIRAILQDLYEVKIHPRIVFGKHPLVIEILAPNRRPVQRTTDLPSFWDGAYPMVRKELAGRYPKHEWR